MRSPNVLRVFSRPLSYFSCVCNSCSLLTSSVGCSPVKARLILSKKPIMTPLFFILKQISQQL